VIPAVRIGATVFRMGLEQLVRSPAVMPLVPGSQRLELQIQANLRDPERWGEPPFHDPRWWAGDPRGFVLRDLHGAWQRHGHLLRIARNMTPAQHAALWSDTGEQASALRRAMRHG
jgi:hypothetical protein